MKIKVTEIEATAEDLRHSNTLSGALNIFLKGALIPNEPEGEEEESEEEDED